MRKTLSDRFREESDLDLAIEVAFCILSTDRGQQTMATLAALLGFRKTLLLLAVLGGKTIHLPTLKAFPHKLILAQCALKVLRNEERPEDLGAMHRISPKVIAKTARRLKELIDARKAALREWEKVADHSTIASMFQDMVLDEGES